MKKVMYTLEEVTEMINKGKGLILAGDEKILSQVPAGHWIGGTIPYFMSENGGEFSQDKIFVTELPSYISKIRIKAYNAETISTVYSDGPEYGFSVVILPSSSDVHQTFALNAPHFDDFALHPLIGWISGVFLDELSTSKPKVYFGEKKKTYENEAVVMHVTLPENKYADIDIVNIFEQDTTYKITFPEDGFRISKAVVNGDTVNFAEFINSNKIDTRFPLVADYCGTIVNTSFQQINDEENQVDFYAPVFKGIEYTLAKPLTDYVSQFSEHLPAEGVDNIFFSCNCILNYLYSELEGKKTANVTGPITFGEIAYQLLNQTMAYLSIFDQTN